MFRDHDGRREANSGKEEERQKGRERKQGKTRLRDGMIGKKKTLLFRQRRDGNKNGGEWR